MSASLFRVINIFFFLTLRRPPRSTLFPTRRSSDLDAGQGHDAPVHFLRRPIDDLARLRHGNAARKIIDERSEEHTSELQSPQYLVCRLLPEKKNKHNKAAGDSLLGLSGDKYKLQTT